MSNARDQILGLVGQRQRALLRQENDLARAVAGAYETARRDLVGRLMDAYLGLGDAPSAAEIRRLALDANLIGAIEQRLVALERETGLVLRGGLVSIGDEAFGAALAEIQLMARALDIRFFPFAINPLLEMVVGPAIDQVPGVVATLRTTLLAELRSGLAQGERMGDLARRVLGQDDSLFRRGMTSAELFIRRLVIQSENTAKLMFYDNAATMIPGLQKQVVAAIGDRTTRCCLAAHGQIKPLDEPFVLMETPRFAPTMMASPFHWNCRTAIAAYHARLEERSSLTTVMMREQARLELMRRQ